MHRRSLEFVAMKYHASESMELYNSKLNRIFHVNGAQIIDIIPKFHYLKYIRPNYTQTCLLIIHKMQTYYSNTDILNLCKFNLILFYSEFILCSGILNTNTRVIFF